MFVILLLIVLVGVVWLIGAAVIRIGEFLRWAATALFKREARAVSRRAGPGWPSNVAHR